MKAAFDQIVGAAVKRQHEPQRVIGDFIAAEIAGSRRGQVPDHAGKAAAGEGCGGVPVRGDADQRHAGARLGDETFSRATWCWWAAPGTGKTHLAIAIARACIRDGARAVLHRG